MDDKDEAPSAKALDDGYNQTYLVMADTECKGSESREVFFRCGNWCYKGLIQFNDIKIGTAELPILIPTLQRQQGSLRYFCNAKSVPVDSDYYTPLNFLEDAVEFIASEIISESVDKELRKMSNVFPWIDDDSASTYFELALSNIPDCMKKISIIASKTYTRGLIIISIYFERTIYFVIQGGEGDQALLDVRFPDVSRHGQGLHISSYNNPAVAWRKLTLWHILESEVAHVPREIPKIKTMNVSSKNYEQTYCILKSSWDSYSPTLSVHHDVLFRFGSWCYAGRVQLTPSLNLADIPYVIPALRMQQSRLDFLCDVNNVPITSPFASSLGYMKEISPLIEEHIVKSEDTLKSLIERLTNMGLGESVSKWLEGDPANSFFEFKIEPNEELTEKFKNIELIVSKCYHSSGIITMVIIFQFNIYVSVLETNGENPLLDSRFPDVSGKGRGYQLSACSNGLPNWPTLRKVSIWQTVSALEQEFRDKAAEFAQTKNRIELKMLNRNDNRDDESLEEEEAKDVDTDLDRTRDSEEFTTSASAAAAAPIVSSSNSGRGAGVSESKSDSPSTKADVKNAVMTTPIKSNTSNNNLESSGRGGESDEKRAYISSTSASLSTPSGASSNNNNNVSAITSPSGGGLEPLRGVGRMALPHHIPKLDGLGKKMDDIRKTMGDEGMRAPWDSKGKPLGSIGGGSSGHK